MEYRHVLLEVEEDRLVGTALRVPDGEVIDRFSLVRR